MTNQTTTTLTRSEHRQADALRVLRLVATGASLWDNLGLHGVPGLEYPNGDLEPIRRSTFTHLERRQLIALSSEEITGAIYGLTDAGRSALGQPQATEGEG